MKAAESRRALLDAGSQLLKERGVAPGLDRVTLKDAIELSGVPRSTAYRLYEGGKGQLEEYRADLLSDLDNSVMSEPAFEAVERVLEEHADELASKDPIALGRVLREVLRQAANNNIEATVASIEWRVFMSSLASLGTGDHNEPALEALFAEASAEFVERYGTLFDRLCTTFGLRVREPLTHEQLGLLITATVEGVALRQHLEPQLGAIMRPTGVNGEMQPWNAGAIAIEALVLTSFEPDPDAEVAADLMSWSAFG